MKSEYEEGKGKGGGGGGGVNNSMFAKLHQQKFQQLQQVVTRECHHPSQHTSEDDESRSSGGGGGGGSGSATKTIMNYNPSEAINKSDGATIEMVRRPRGRPPGSKNKPKPPVIITRDNMDSTAMRPYVLEVPGGLDVVDALARFIRRRNIGLCVLSGSGTVANVTLRQPSATPGATVTFHGRFDILSISATLLPPSSSSSIPSSVNSFTISLAGPSGQIVGGSVAGSLLAAGTIYIIAAAFTDPSYHRLPAEDELQSSISGNVGHSPSGSGGGEGSHDHAVPPPGPAESCGMSIYGCHLSSDVIWAPTARQQQQPPPPPPHF